MSRLTATGLTVGYDEKIIIPDLDLAVPDAAITTVIGPNGCGKSTLLSVLSAVRRPATGTVHLDGRDVTGIGHRELARMRALVTQHNRVDTPFTVAEVVEMGRYPWLRMPEALRSPDLIAAAIDRCDLADLVSRPFPQLSGGQQARVSLARALAQDTPVLMLDEPTAAMDIRHQEQVLEILRERCDAGVTVLLVVHDLTLAAAYADRVAVMKAGEILADGPPPEVMTAELLSHTYDHPVIVWEHPETGAPVILPQR